MGKKGMKIMLKKQCSKCGIINNWKNKKCICGNSIFIIKEQLKKGGRLD